MTIVIPTYSIQGPNQNLHTRAAPCKRFWLSANDFDPKKAIGRELGWNTYHLGNSVSVRHRIMCYWFFDWLSRFKFGISPSCPPLIHRVKVEEGFLIHLRDWVLRQLDVIVWSAANGEWPMQMCDSPSLYFCRGIASERCTITCVESGIVNHKQIRNEKTLK